MSAVIGTNIGSGALPIKMESAPVHVGTYQGFGGKKVEVIFKASEGLRATLTLFTLCGATELYCPRLKLTGIPQKLLRDRNFTHIDAYLSQSYFSCVRRSGKIKALDVRLSGLRGGGGGKSPIPFQPGLALGSVVRCETLDKMEKYAEEQAQITDLENTLSALKHEIGQLESKNKSLKDSDPIKRSLTTRIETLQTRQSTVSTKLSDLYTTEVPLFSPFVQAVESPIDFGASRIEIQPRGFDSLHFSSDYFKKNETHQVIQNDLEHSAHSFGLSISAKVGYGLFGGSAKGALTFSKATAERVTAIVSESNALGALVINAFVTTRHVRAFTHMHFDRSKLKMVINAFKGGDEDQKRYGICNGRIYILTEAVMGAFFSAIVKMKQEETTTQDSTVKQSQSSAGVSGGGGMNYATIAKGSGAASYQFSSGQQNEKSAVDSLSKTKISIEILSEGVIPTFGRSLVEQEVMKHLSLDPSKYELTQTDLTDAKDLASTNPQIQQAAIQRRQLKMEGAQNAALSAINGLASSKESHHLHTIDSAHQAYESFSKQITADPSCGVPIGFHYRTYTQKDLKAELEKMNKQPDKPEPKKSEPTSSPQPAVSGLASSSSSSSSSQPPPVRQ